MQLCAMRDDRSWRRCRPAARLRPNGALTHGRSVTGLRAANLQSCGRLQSNGTPASPCSLSRTAPGRYADAALLCLVEAVFIASLSTLRLGATATTGLCCSLELVQSKKASRAKPTVSYNFTATRRRRSLELVQSKKASRAKPTHTSILYVGS